MIFVGTSRVWCFPGVSYYLHILHEGYSTGYSIPIILILIVIVMIIIGVTQFCLLMELYCH
jgi:hypothetical protein